MYQSTAQSWWMPAQLPNYKAQGEYVGKGVESEYNQFAATSELKTRHQRENF